MLESIEHIAEDTTDSRNRDFLKQGLYNKRLRETLKLSAKRHNNCQASLKPTIRRFRGVKLPLLEIKLFTNILDLSKINCSLEQSIELLGKVGRGITKVGNIELLTESELNPITQLIHNLFEGH